MRCMYCLRDVRECARRLANRVGKCCDQCCHTKEDQ
jgi:hypothetical protein